MWPRAPEPPLENAVYVGIDVSQEHLDAAVVDAPGNLIRAAQRYENAGPGFDRLWADTLALGRSLSDRPVAYALEASGGYHLSLLAFLLEKEARV
jgi:transposase